MMNKAAYTDLDALAHTFHAYNLSNVFFSVLERWLILDRVYTGWSKKAETQFYFCDNIGNSAPILTILSLLQAEIYGA